MANKVNIKIDGLKELEKDFKRLTKCFKPEEIKKVAVDSAEIIRADAARRAPLGPTGNLKKSNIVKTLDRNKKRPSAIAAVDRKVAPHAHLLEFGTAKMSAKPFFRPAVESQGDKAASKFRDSLEKLVKEAVKSK